jgi:hypothetical protein
MAALFATQPAAHVWRVHHGLSARRPSRSGCRWPTCCSASLPERPPQEIVAGAHRRLHSLLAGCGCPPKPSRLRLCWASAERVWCRLELALASCVTRGSLVERC